MAQLVHGSNACYLYRHHNLYSKKFAPLSNGTRLHRVSGLGPLRWHAALSPVTVHSFPVGHLHKVPPWLLVTVFPVGHLLEAPPWLLQTASTAVFFLPANTAQPSSKITNPSYAMKQ